jgi:hypothetical protein
MAEVTRVELARQVVVNLAAGAASGYAGPLAGTAAAGAAPAVLAAMDYIAAVIGKRRREHAAEALSDAADEAGSQTPEEFTEFVQAALRDDEYQELLARALAVAMDTAMRDKRRALGRSVASAADETGTAVDDELVFIRVLADLGEAHVRLLRLMSTVPGHITTQGIAVRQWYPWSICQADPGLARTVWQLLQVLDRHGLISGGSEHWVPGGVMEPEYEITPYGEWFLNRLAAPDDAPLEMDRCEPSGRDMTHAGLSTHRGCPGRYMLYRSRAHESSSPSLTSCGPVCSLEAASANALWRASWPDSSALKPDSWTTRSSILSSTISR